MSIENLNKENFWDDIEQKFPLAFKHFSKWIDEYKKEVGWDRLFNNGGKDNHGANAHGIKFHDLPFDMQNGVLARYDMELYNNKAGKGKEAYEAIAKKIRPQIRSIFPDLEKILIERNKHIN